MLEQCIGLDPDRPDSEASAEARGSDGRSVWIEPVAPRWSSQQVIDQELDLLAWTLAAQGLEPSPSTSIERGLLDVLQAAAAGEVAGGDRLVVIIGPAGAGRTSMLTAAIDDLRAQGRPVFGIAPTAKAARVLEDETGIRTDTLAKLLREYARDGGPRPEWRLRRGTTVIVDEAGMVSTPDLWRLTDLARQLDLRVVLVGDSHQLQAVARGGMFPELAATATRTVELEHVHRFTEPWEAAASLRRRRGDPAALSEYLSHGRVEPRSLDEHLRAIGRAWAETHATGRSLAITTTTNDHATLINHRIQNARREASALIGGPVTAADGEVFVGDVVMTRRNDRTLATTAGDSVRNRDRWTITATHDDGSITARSHAGEATVTLPAGYMREFVQLAYATTEHGNEGITTDASITLVTGTTTGRGLYVGATCGRDDNQLLERATTRPAHSPHPTSTNCPKPSQARREANLDAGAASAAGNRASSATSRTRRPLERAAAAATERAAVSARHVDELEAIYQPVTEQREPARRALAVAIQRLDKHDRRAVDLRDYRADDIALDQAITTWRTWAAGHAVTDAGLDHAAVQLARYVDTVPEASALLTAFGPRPPPTTRTEPARTTRGPSRPRLRHRTLTRPATGSTTPRVRALGTYARERWLADQTDPR